MDFNTLLGQLETSRPDLSESLALVRQLQKNRNDNSNDNDGQDNDGHASQLELLLEKQQNINRKLLRHFEQLKQNYQSLIGQLDVLAEALGACPHCWGEDTSCHYCRGKGVPGYFPPDQAQFDFFIKPVIQKFKSE
jgi:hypothetical protein